MLVSKLALDGGRWFQCQWLPAIDSLHIILSIKEMIPLGRTTVSCLENMFDFWSDNSLVVALLNSGCSREEQLVTNAHYWVSIVFITAKYNFVLSASHAKQWQLFCPVISDHNILLTGSKVSNLHSTSSSGSIKNS